MATIQRPEASVGEHSQLAHGSVSLGAILFQSVTTMAPGAGIAFTVPIGAAFAAGALPLSTIFALIACLFAAISIGQMARFLPSAGGLATYTARGLGNHLGFLVAWAFAAGYLLIVPFLALIAGNLVGTVVHTEWGWSYSAWWLIASLLASVIVFFINIVGIRISTAAGLILGIFEVIVLLALSVTLIIKAGGHNDLSVFSTKFSTVKGYSGTSGIVAGIVYVVLAFVGFDAAAPLAEEAKNPRRTVLLAVVGSALSIGLIYILSTYAATVYYGPLKMVGFQTLEGGNPWDYMARSVWGIGWVILFIALINSSLACMNGGANGATRVIYSMGRIGTLPSVFQRTHRQWLTPHWATIFTFVVGTIITVWTGEVYGPVTALSLVGTMIAAFLIPIYILVNVACAAYFYREQRKHFNPILHGLVPALGVLVFIPPFFANLGLPIPFLSFISALPFPLNFAGWTTLGWMIAGVLVLIYLSRKYPERVAASSKIFLEDSLGDDAAGLVGLTKEMNPPLP